MKNLNLAQARKVNNDEFYTSYEDIASELVHYQDSLQGKVIYCNCDDQWSNFRAYFMDHFGDLHLKKLYCSGISGYCMEYDGKNVIESTINGDFRSADSLRILEQSDLCVTNPPFSLFREYVSLVKNFLIIGNKNAIAYKEVFPLLQSRIVSLGHTQPSTFTTPNGSVANLNGLCRWFTTLSVEGKSTWTPTARYNSSYQCFDNYPAINVDRVSDIPCDYTGLMGVPITALDKLDFTTYEVVDLITRYAVIDTIGVKNHQLTEINGVPKYARLIIMMKNFFYAPLPLGGKGANRAGSIMEVQEQRVLTTTECKVTKMEGYRYE